MEEPQDLNATTSAPEQNPAVFRIPEKLFLPLSIAFAGILLSGAIVFAAMAGPASPDSGPPPVALSKITPEKGVALPVKWGDLGKKLFETGAIDKAKFEALYAGRGGLSESDKQLAFGSGNGPLTITPENSGLILNLLWAFGLANKNPVLEKGPIQDKRFGGAEKFASTGGWTLAKGDPMGHFSAHAFVALTPEQQALVDKIAPTIYRPCCNNPTHFPDCNHGMAMLGLLELMAAANAGEEEMYRAALVVNSYWFPDQYRTIATLYEKRGVSWENVNPKEALGANFSSASGYQNVLSQVDPVPAQGGGGCSA